MATGMDSRVHVASLANPPPDTRIRAPAESVPDRSVGAPPLAPGWNPSVADVTCNGDESSAVG